MREAIFNALVSRGLTGDVVALDLFAGTGALGIEALSRGARRVVFVENDRAALSALRANLVSTGLGEGAEVVPTRVEAWLESAAAQGQHFDVVFCDPPYVFDAWEELVDGLSADLVVMESDRPIEVAGYDVVRQRRYGTTFVTFAEPMAEGDRHPPAAPESEMT